jgi:ABC-type sugar transport system substrate-binding protein
VLEKQAEAASGKLPAVTVSLGAAQKVTLAQGKALNVAFDGYGRGFAYTTPQYEAAEKEGAKLGFDVTAFDPAGESQKQVAQLETIMNSGRYNALVVYPLSLDLECNLLTKQMPAHGIIVVAIGLSPCNNKLEQTGLVSTIVDVSGTPGSFLAWAEEIAEANPGAHQMIFENGPATEYTSKVAQEAIEKMTKAHPNIHLVDTFDTNYIPSEALKKTEDALQQHPEADIIASAAPENTQGAITALRIAGKTGVKVYDFGGSKYIVHQIQHGTVSMSVPLYPYTSTKTALQALEIVRGGGKVPNYIPYAGHAVEAIRKQGSKVLFVTKENAAQFLEQDAEY